MNLRALARAVVALVKGGRPRPVVDRIGDGGPLDACVDAWLNAKPAQPRPPTPGEMAEGKRP